MPLQAHAAPAHGIFRVWCAPSGVPLQTTKGRSRLTPLPPTASSGCGVRLVESRPFRLQVQAAPTDGNSPGVVRAGMGVKLQVHAAPTNGIKPGAVRAGMGATDYYFVQKEQQV